MQFYLLITSFMLLVTINLAHRFKYFPPVFSDKQLPSSQRDGQEIEHLGHIIKLKTFFSPTRINSLDTKFSIYNRRGYIEDITFAPDKNWIPSLGYGPYQYDLRSMESSGFNASLRTVVIISGFLTNERVTWMDEAKNRWLDLEDVNVVLVTWKRANRYIYSTAVANTPLVARQVTIFLYYLAAMNGFHLTDDAFAKNIHFIGHSLGSHIAGFVGQDFGGKMGRITGLDPAGPSFDRMDPKYRLDISDARFVDVIHTNSGRMSIKNAIASVVFKQFDVVMDKKKPKTKHFDGARSTTWFGIDEQIGHIDYYANNGKVQPGCDDLFHICDHGRAQDIYLDILEHEKKLRCSNPSKDSLKQKRLRAFNSIDYENFLSGNNFRSMCPSLLSRRGKVDQTFNHCSVPIDQLTPLDELMEELSTEYNIQFDETGRISSDKYFFKTHPKSPLVGDHYLLKVRLDSPPSWERKCALRAVLNMADGSSTTIELKKQLTPVKMDNFYGIAVPFINPISIRPCFRCLDDSCILYNSTQQSILGQIFDTLPKEVHLILNEEGSANAFNKFKNEFLKLIDKRACTKRSSDRCHMSVISLEVHPIIGITDNLVGLYGSWLDSTDGYPFHLLTPKEHIGFVEESSKHCSPLSSSNPILTRKLDAFVYE